MQASVQEVEATQIIVLLTAIVIVAFWRTVVRWLIVVASTVIIATFGFGLIMVWQTTHHMAG
jgi:hypothetical protein